MSELPSHVRRIVLPEHVPDDIRVWLVEIDPSAPFDLVLSEAERARAQRYLRHAAGARFATVRAALRTLLSLHVDEDAASLVIETDSHGRPTLALQNAPDFNVSHSGVYGAIALSSTRRVGIDIEEARVSLDWQKLTRMVFSNADQQAVDAMPAETQRAAFFECWSAKEALLKTHGTGMGAGALDMDTFSVMPCMHDRFVLSQNAGAFAVSRIKAPSGYAAALSWSL